MPIPVLHIFFPPAHFEASFEARMESAPSHIFQPLCRGQLRSSPGFGSIRTNYALLISFASPDSRNIEKPR